MPLLIWPSASTKLIRSLALCAAQGARPVNGPPRRRANQVEVTVPKALAELGETEMRATDQKSDQIPDNMRIDVPRIGQVGIRAPPFAPDPFGGPPGLAMWPNPAHRKAALYEAPRRQRGPILAARPPWNYVDDKDILLRAANNGVVLAGVQGTKSSPQQFAASGVKGGSSPLGEPPATSESNEGKTLAPVQPVGSANPSPNPYRSTDGKRAYRADEDGFTDQDEPPETMRGRPSVFARQDPQWEYFEIGPPRRPAEEAAVVDGAEEKRTLCRATKTSAGILLCRVHPRTNRPEVILVHKRYTYAFSEFVYGRYSRQNQKSLMALFEQMTTEELLDVWSLNFDQMWYRIWLSGPRRELFTKKHTKFYTSFIRDDGGRALQQMLRQVQDRGVPFWEIPKGRPNGKEGDLVCAMREFTEETGVEKKDYRLLPGVKRRVSFVHMGVRYVHVYYVAVAGARLYSEPRSGWRRPVVPGRGVLSTADFMGEVDEVRWMDIEHVRFVDDGRGHLEAIIAPAFSLVKRFLKGRWDQRRARPANISSLDPGVIGALAALATAASPAAKLDTDGSKNLARDNIFQGAPQKLEGRPKPKGVHDPPVAATNLGNEIFQALLSLEYGQETRRAARRAARRQRASWKNQTLPPRGASAPQGRQDEKGGNKVPSKSQSFGRTTAGPVGEKPKGVHDPLVAIDCDSHNSFVATGRSQSPMPGGEPRPSTPDQIARRAAAAISRSRTPSAETLLKNLSLTEIYPVETRTTELSDPGRPGNACTVGGAPATEQTNNVDPVAATNGSSEDRPFVVGHPGQGKKRPSIGTKSLDAGSNVSDIRAAPYVVKLVGNSGSYVGALGFGPLGPHNAAQSSSATDDEAQSAPRARRNNAAVSQPTLGKSESLEGTLGQTRPRGARQNDFVAPPRKTQKPDGSAAASARAPTTARTASSADEGWSFVQRRGNKKKQAADEKNTRSAGALNHIPAFARQADVKAGSRFGPRGGRKERQQ